jgi:hypothetical protein
MQAKAVWHAGAQTLPASFGWKELEHCQQANDELLDVSKGCLAQRSSNIAS